MAGVIDVCAKRILEVLANNPNEQWSEARMYSHLKEELGSRTGDYHVTYPMRALMAVGVIDGVMRNGKVMWARYKVDPKTLSATSGGEPTVLRSDMLKAVETVRGTFESRVKEGLAQIDELKKELAEKTSSERIVRVDVTEGKKTVRKIEAIFHTKFTKLCDVAKQREPILLYGPTGSGKSHICEQLAEVLGLSFFSISCSAGMSEGQLTGRLLPMGVGGKFEFVGTEFLKAFENGGVFLFDEIDAADPNTLLVINSALANGRISLPNRPKQPVAKMHKDFVCIAAANTLGTGADRMYSGRAKLDASTLDRFAIGKVFLDYDLQVESQLCPDDDLRAHLTRYRKAINANRLERAMSTRFMAKAYKMKAQAGWNHEEIDEVFFQGWREDEVNKVKSYNR